MTIGIIGTGNMGTILTEAIIDSGACRESDLIITNRTKEKAFLLQTKYPGIALADDAADVVERADIVLICLKPLDIHPLLEHIKRALTPEHLVISITSPITVGQLEKAMISKAARMIPSITNRALGGSTLFTFGKRCSQNDRLNLLEFAGKFSKPIEIDESITRISSDLSSCGPAFISYLLEQMIKASVKETDISRDIATRLVTDMMIGYGQLLEKNIYSLETLRKKVHVKGGVTGEGLKVLEEEVGDLFRHVFQKTHQKFREDHLLIDKQYDQSI
ncbi:MAG: late competence protein ComER [Tuberibacillus sp.]